MRRPISMIVLLVPLIGCAERTSNDDDSAAIPEWSECAMKDEVQNCAELCTSQGMVCRPNGCAADPEFCDPEPCEMATQVLALDAEALCADPSVGGFVASTCEAPIDWLFSNTVRCCCAAQD